MKDLPRAQKAEIAKQLRARGLTHREIGERLGYTSSAITKLLNPDAAREWNRRQEQRPERKAAKRRWEVEHDRPPCSRCGAPMGVGAHRYERDTCRTCYDRDRAAKVAARAERIVAWWDEGLSLQEIADCLGWSRGQVGVEMHRLRRRGYDLPYRRRPVETTTTTPR